MSDASSSTTTPYRIVNSKENSERHGILTLYEEAIRQLTL
jgi:hypothetical protein